MPLISTGADPAGDACGRGGAASAQRRSRRKGAATFPAGAGARLTVRHARRRLEPDRQRPRLNCYDRLMTYAPKTLADGTVLRPPGAGAGVGGKLAGRRGRHVVRSLRKDATFHDSTR
jgi:hypothetical protein